MKPTITATDAIETAIPTAPVAPKQAQTSTITLTAPDGTTMQIVAERKRDSAASYVLTIATVDGKNKTSRGMSETHDTFEDAKAAIAVQATKAEKLGWTRKVATRGFVAKPDAFSSLPTAPKVAPVVAKAPRLKK